MYIVYTHLKENDVQIVCINCQGLNFKEKKRDVLNFLKSNILIISCLQYTHFTENDELVIKNQ